MKRIQQDFDNLINKFDIFKKQNLFIENILKNYKELLWSELAKKCLQKLNDNIKNIINIYENNYKKQLEKCFNDINNKKLYKIIDDLTIDLNKYVNIECKYSLLFDEKDKNKEEKFNLLNLIDIDYFIEHIYKNKNNKFFLEKNKINDDELNKILEKFCLIKLYIIDYVNTLNSILFDGMYKKIKIILWKKSLSLLMTINEYLQLNKRYQKFKNKISNKNKEKLINSFFNRLLNLFWIRFNVEARDYTDIVLKILFNNNNGIIEKIRKKDVENVEKLTQCVISKYLDIWLIIKNNTFLKSIFLGDTISSYTIYSFVVHDYNFDLFTNKNKIDINLINYEFQNLLKLLYNGDLSKIKNEIMEIYMSYMTSNNDFLNNEIPPFEKTTSRLNIISDLLNIDDLDKNYNFDKFFSNFDNDFNLNNIAIFNFLNFYNIFDFLDYVYKEMYGKDENDNKW